MEQNPSSGKKRSKRAVKCSQSTLRTSLFSLQQTEWLFALSFIDMMVAYMYSDVVNGFAVMRITDVKPASSADLPQYMHARMHSQRLWVVIVKTGVCRGERCMDRLDSAS